MDLTAAILDVHSVVNRDKIIHFIGNDPAKFDQLMQLFFSPDLRLCQNASWILNYSARKNPDLVRPYLPEMIAKASLPEVHDACRRNTMRILEEIELPNELLGPIADLAFGFLEDVKVAVGIKAFSLTVAYKICLIEPELGAELKALIIDQMPLHTAAFTSRGRKILKLLDK